MSVQILYQAISRRLHYSIQKFVDHSKTFTRVVTNTVLVTQN
jgi:hypothetical protein